MKLEDGAKFRHSQHNCHILGQYFRLSGCKLPKFCTGLTNRHSSFTNYTSCGKTTVRNVFVRLNFENRAYFYYVEDFCDL